MTDISILNEVTKVFIPKLAYTQQEKPYIEGTINNGDYSFSAYVTDEPTKYGINGSTVSRLVVSHGEKVNNQNAFIYYDGGWDMPPEEGVGKTIFNRIMRELIKL